MGVADEPYVLPSQSLEDAKTWLRARLERGARCPCCRQMAKVYTRALNSAMAAGLILLYRTTLPEHGFIHITKLITKRAGFAVSGRGDFAKLVHWGLIEERQDNPQGPGRTSGYWRITEKGAAFVRREIAVTSHVRIYDSRCLGFVGEEVYVDDCLKKKFSYADLMASEVGV